MKLSDLAVVCTTALATTLLALVVLWPYRVSAIGPKESETALVATPILRSQGCELSLVSLPQLLKPGDAPAVQVKAVNTTGAAVNLNATLCLMLTPPTNPMARVMPLPGEAWKGGCPFGLGPHETQTLALTPNVKLAPGAHGSFILKAGDASVVALRFAVENPAARAVPVAAGASRK